MAYIGSSPTKVVSRQSANIFTYTATANQTAFTGSDANGNTLACTPSDIMVHMNGLRLEESDFTATTTTVTLGSGAAAGDEVTITAFVTFETADAYTKSGSDARYVNVTGDTMSGNLQSTELVANNAGSNTNIRLQNTASGSGSSDGFVIQNATNSKVYLWNYENADVLFGTNSIERLKIDSEGRVTMPSQPAFYMRNSSDGSRYKGGTVYVNRGNHWNNTTGTFTAPVAGAYQFGAFGQSVSGTNTFYWLAYQNGGVRGAWYDTSGSGYKHASLTVILDMAANDTFHIAGSNLNTGGQNGIFGHLLG